MNYFARHNLFTQIKKIYLIAYELFIVNLTMIRIRRKSYYDIFYCINRGKTWKNKIIDDEVPIKEEYISYAQFSPNFFVLKK